jgi:transposase
MAEKRSRRRFTDEFKAETVKLVKQSDRTMSDIAMELGISAKSVGEWVRNAADSKKSMNEDERAELKRPRKVNSELRMEKEILRKATLSSTRQCNTSIECF